jgi:uncharacterized paraquat-inducible protein A
MAQKNEPNPLGESIANEPKQKTADQPARSDFYCPQCGCEVDDPLTCGDCSAIICRRCGTPLESAGDLGIG